jgi:serine/threonine protein phosphatase 1
VFRDSDIEHLASVWGDFPLDTPPAAFPDFTARFLWSRVVMSERRRSQGAPFLEGLSPTFCGHTIDYEIRTALSHICLDTGAFLAGYETAEKRNFGLSLVNVTQATAYSLSGAPGSQSIRECPMLLSA